MKKLSFLFSFLLAGLGVFAEAKLGWALLLLPLFVFFLVPFLDSWLGEDPSNPSETDSVVLQKESYYRYLTYLWAFFQLFFVIWVSYRVATIERTYLELALSILSVGILTGGIGITVGHELGHKNTKWEQNLARMIYMTVSYMHFHIEHNRGHHVHVATESDPASSRKNESFYAFLPRTVVGSFRSAWEIEKKRLSKLGLGPFHYRNEMLYCIAIPLIFAFSLFGFFSLVEHRLVYNMLFFFFAQSIVAFSLLEVVNYIEHYGLYRKQVTADRFERVLPIHSWNQNFFLSNALLFQLQRHSDHHANAGRRYQTLRHYPEAPQLPFGYEVMILIALVPPLWFRFMNPRLQDWEKRYSAA